MNLRDAIGIIEKYKSSRMQDEKMRVESMKMTRQNVEGGRRERK